MQQNYDSLISKMMDDYKDVLYEEQMREGLLITLVFDAMWNSNNKYELLRKLIEIQKV